MTQQFLTNFSVVVIKSLEADSSLYLGNESFIRKIRRIQAARSVCTETKWRVFLRTIYSAWR
jgi:hypothetical protein